ncbi:MAG: segregation and condensation protein A [Deltaproteobacteria bacterium]|jgi:segregation and condensation protein A
MAERTRRSRTRGGEHGNVAGRAEVSRDAEESRPPGARQSSEGKGESVQALDPNFQLRLPAFEGPLDLLLHLIQKHELDILDLPIAFVVERYLAYLTVMETLDLDVASEYLVMAATLAHIKSKMLLPPDPSQADEDAAAEEEVDPRAELIRRLLEYQKYKHAAEQLLARGVAGRDVFTRGMEAPEAMGPAPLASIGLFKLLDAFQSVLKRANQELAFEITAEGVSIQDRMAALTERIRGRRHCSFDELFDDARSVYDVVVTFLAILEMAKRRLTRIYQADALAPIHLELLVTEVDDSMVAGVDEYDGRAPASVATLEEDLADESVARPGEDPLGEALDPEEEGLQDAAATARPEAESTDGSQDDEE